MNIKEKALEFAKEAHKGQYRKSENDKPMILHPIIVGKILEQYGYDENVVSAGYLHDVVEDTKYTHEDIKRIFGADISALVYGASEIDKKNSWEKRKQHTIESIKHLTERQKAVICADKISNLEDMSIIFDKNGTQDFSCFKRGKKEQKWYYEEIYKSLIINNNMNKMLYKRLKKAINSVFYNKYDEFIVDEVFDEKYDLFIRLNKLHAYKRELIKLKSIITLERPYTIEFAGTKNSGKTSSVKKIYDFFNNSGLRVKMIDDSYKTKMYREDINKNLKKDKINKDVVEYIYTQIKEKCNNCDILLLDESINECMIKTYKESLNEFSKNKQLLNLCEKRSEDIIDTLVLTHVDSINSLKRDYLNNIYLEKREYNEKDIINYNKKMDLVSKLIDDSINIETNDLTIYDTTLIAIENIMPRIRKRYIDTFKNMI